MNSRFTRLLVATACFGMLILITGCGRNNIFSWAHSSGSVTTIDSLSSDAYTALVNKDYVKAMEYYAKILQTDPNNSEAIYGYSVATLANSGLDIASLISNMISETPSAPSRLAPAISSLVYASPGNNLLPDTIINNRANINAAINVVLASNLLPKIVKGLADGKIKYDSADVNINIAFCLMLRSALRLNSLVEFGTDYDVGTIPSVDAAFKSAARESMKDIASAYLRIQVILAKMKNNTTISNINDDFTTLFNNFKTALAENGVDVTDISLGTDYL
ncbi:MAG: hypothetical protein ABII64_10530 [Elusimicrobiota bacterium]